MITDLIAQAQATGIKVYPQNGQINVDLPWSPENIPPPARYILGELKKRRPELLAHFILSSPAPDILLYLEALRAYGVHLVTDPEIGLKAMIPPPGCRQDDMIIKLLDRPLRNHWYIALEYLTTHGQTTQPG